MSSSAEITNNIQKTMVKAVKNFRNVHGIFSTIFRRDRVQSMSLCQTQCLVMNKVNQNQLPKKPHQQMKGISDQVVISADTATTPAIGAKPSEIPRTMCANEEKRLNILYRAASISKIGKES